MVELIVGLVALLAIFAGILQLASLTRTHTDTMVAARQQAGALAMLDLGSGSGLLTAPEYIHDWDPAGDERQITADDLPIPDDPGPFAVTVVEQASPNDAGWTVMARVPNNPVLGLRGNMAPASFFGLVRGHETRSVPIIPAVRDLIYRSDSIEVESEVWMTWTKGMY